LPNRTHFRSKKTNGRRNADNDWHEKSKILDWNVKSHESHVPSGNVEASEIGESPKKPTIRDKIKKKDANKWQF
jgi:hypothetical protein